MKRFVFFSVLSLAVFASCSKDQPFKAVEDVCTKMDDNTFASYCRTEFDTDKDGKLSMQEASVVEVINVKGKGITSLKGLEYFINLKTLDCSENEISSLDISGNTSLTSLYCNQNKIKALDLSKNIRLQRLISYDNDIVSLDVSNNKNLVSISCRGNRLSSLDISMLHWLDRSLYVIALGLQKDGTTITITDLKENWGILPSDVEETGIKWNWK